MKSLKRRSSAPHNGIKVAAFLLMVISLAGCNIFGPHAVYDTADVAVSVGASGPSGSVVPGGVVSGPGAPSRAIGETTSPDEIATVVLTVAGEDRFGVYQDPLATLTLTESGATWSGSVPALPLGPALTFTVEAFDGAGTLIYTGTTTTALSALQLTVALVLLPYDDGFTVIGFPVIRQITRPAEIVENTDATVSVNLEGSTDETLSIELTSGGGGFAPASPIGVPLSGTAATLDLTYSAPADTPATYLHTIRAENEQGNSVSRDFTTTVVWETQDAGISIGGIAPAVVGFDLGLNAAGDIVMTATVTDDGPLSEISYDWSYDGGLAFADSSANPAILEGYDETATGTVSLTVTDSDTSIIATGLATTVTFLLPAGLFPDDVVVDETAGPPLVVVTNAYDRSVSFIDIQTDVELARVQLVGTTQGVDVTPDGRYAWIANSAPAYTLSVIDLADFSVANVYPVTGNSATFPLEVAASADGTEIYLTEHSGNALAIIDAATGAVVDRITGIGIRTSGLAYDPATGIGYVVAGTSKTLSRIDMATRTVTDSVTPGVVYPFGVDFSAARNEVYVTGNNIAVHDGTSLALLRSFPIYSSPFFVAVGPDNRHLYVAQTDTDSVLKVDLDSPGGDIVGTLAVGDSPRRLIFSPDGSKLYVPNILSGDVSVIDVATFTLSAVIPVGGGANYAAIRP